MAQGSDGVTAPVPHVTACLGHPSQGCVLLAPEKSASVSFQTCWSGEAQLVILPPPVKGRGGQNQNKIKEEKNVPS